MEAFFKRASENQKPVELIYLSKEKEWSQRAVKILQNAEGFILAYCLERRQVRKFLKQNIYSALYLKSRKRRIGA
ncbi:hypothetical protein [Halobacillus litoralis]|uniref:hypothetical protein n=1 Tax=Halobacillus litoralis TaxID=45668 RepID=UPI001CFD9E3F|nr:hypothetical protein [Halobacillus litoralis]